MNFRRKPIHNPEVFDINEMPDVDIDIEDEIGALVADQRLFQHVRPPSGISERSVQDYAPPDHVPEVTYQDIGRVTAEAVMVPWEDFAKNIEAMREPVRELAMQHQKAMEELAASIKNLDETAQRYRTMGESKRELIEKSTATIAEVNELCAAVRAKIDP